MTVFVDTSAFFSLLDRDERNHTSADRIWRTLLWEDRPLLTSNYVVVETTALLQSRLGMAAVSDFTDALLPLVAIAWIDQELHRAAVGALLIANRRQLSLVDCVSFELCRRQGIGDVFAFDQHFAEQGLRPLVS